MSAAGARLDDTAAHFFCNLRVQNKRRVSQDKLIGSVNLTFVDVCSLSCPLSLSLVLSHLTALFFGFAIGASVTVVVCCCALLLLCSSLSWFLFLVLAFASPFLLTCTPLLSTHNIGRLLEKAP